MCMPYSSRLRKSIGALHSTLSEAGFGMQDARFAKHGVHQPDFDAPLIMVACSGGRDSMALAAVAAKVCASWGLRCGAVIVDHQLQDGSAQVAQAAAERCAGLGLDPVRVCAIEVPSAKGLGVEAVARQARYDAIVKICGELGAAAVLLAHTKNDQAETVVMGLLRSAGLDAIAGMESTFMRDGMLFLRPWLNVTREETTGICEDLQLQWWDDPTNGPDVGNPGTLNETEDGGTTVELPSHYPLRSRVRHDLMPYIERFSGSDVVDRLSLGARLAQDDRRYLDSVAQRTIDEAFTFGQGAIEIDTRSMLKQDVAIRRRAIAHALAQAGIDCSARQVEGIDALIADWHGQRGVNLSSGYSAYRQKHVIRVCQDGGHANR